MHDKYEIKLTGDDTKTIWLPKLNESYHSMHGAWNEGQHVFIVNGISNCEATPIRALELGFGTGLNALLCALYAIKNKSLLYYHSLERYPLGQAIHKQMHYENKLDADFSNLYKLIYQASWEEEVHVDPFFNLKKMNKDFFDFKSEELYDIILYDAFAPDKQSELWTKQALERAFDLIKEGGFLTTYCAKGSFKRMLKTIGFHVETLDGPPGKREMTRAWRL